MKHSVGILCYRYNPFYIYSLKKQTLLVKMVLIWFKCQEISANIEPT